MSDYFYSLDMLCLMAATEANKRGDHQRANAILLACYNLEQGGNR